MTEPATIRPMYEAAWRDDRNLGDPVVLQAVLDEAGFDGGALLARTGDPEVKAALKASTTMAVEAGVCGAPSFRVNDRWLFWGQDRMDMVDAALRGWEPRVG
jgi:2-hydroxychromene-2-carboxylate isomerase